MRFLLKTHLRQRSREAVLNCYQSFERLDNRAFLSRTAIYQLLTDVLFGVPHQDAVQRFVELGADVSEYYFVAGNPFPGYFLGQANHCVDLIFVYDCFHNGLEGVNRSQRHEYYDRMVSDVRSGLLNFIMQSSNPMKSSGTTRIYDVDGSTRYVHNQNDPMILERGARYRVLRDDWVRITMLCKDILGL